MVVPTVQPRHASLPTSCRATEPSPCRESGFGIIEVIIAVLLLSVVIGAIAFAAAGGESLRGATRLQSSMSHTGKSIQEDLIQNRDWMQQCTTLGAECNAIESVILRDGGKLLELDDVEGDATLLLPETFAMPIDSEVDGVGQKDSDGVIPDYFRISVQIAPSTDVANRFGTDPKRAVRTFVTSVDRRGKVQLGSLTVQACRVLNQVDSRMTIQGCRETGLTSIEMSPCPPQPLAGCKPAFNWVDGRAATRTDPSPHVTMERVKTMKAFQVISADGSVRLNSSDAKKIDGEWVFQNVPAGVYRFDGLPQGSGSSPDRWEAKEIPAYHGTNTAANYASISVEPGIQSRALILFRPKKGVGNINLKFRRSIDYFKVLGPHTGAKEWATRKLPTKSYTGIRAEDVCASYAAANAADGSNLKCVPVDGGAPNCQRVLMIGYYIGAGGESLDVNKTYTTCTFYSQWLTHTWYQKDSADLNNIVPGAVATASYTSQSAPDFRAARAEDDDDGRRNCLVIGHKFGAALSSDHTACNASVSLKKFDSGLYTGLRDFDGATRANYNEGIFAGNSNNPNSGNWIKDPGLWVRPSGVIVGSRAGVIGTNPTVTMQGKGECWWQAPSWFLGKVEARDCGPCNVVWKNKRSYSGACALLVETCVHREVWEEGDLGTVQLNGWATNPAGKCKSNRNPWPCASRPPTILDGNCSPASPPMTFGDESYDSPNGGKADVAGGSSNQPPKT